MKETIKIEIAKKYTTDLDTVITRENVLYLCENMALCALKRKTLNLRIFFKGMSDTLNHTLKESVYIPYEMSFPLLCTVWKTVNLIGFYLTIFLPANYMTSAGRSNIYC